METEELMSDSTGNRPRKVKSPVTGYLVLAAIVCFAGSSLQFGYNLTVINAPQKIIIGFFHDVDNIKFLWSFAVSVFAVGGMFGAFLGPHVAKKIGRKKTLMLNNALAISGGVFLGLTKAANSVAILIIGRILVGINAGVNTSVAPMYLSEIAPVQLRGSLGTLCQFGIVIGLLMGNVLGLHEVLGNNSGWPYLFLMTAFIAIAQLLVLPICPESPRYLIAIKNDEENATKNLQKLRGYADVSEEINEIKMEAQKEAEIVAVSIIELFRNVDYRKPLLISVILQFSQQLSGIGGILYYSTKLFTDVGLTELQSQKASCGVGVLSVVMTIIVVFLVEIKGRRLLLLIGLGGMAIFYLITTICFYYVERVAVRKCIVIWKVHVFLYLVFIVQQQEWAKYSGVVFTLLSVALFQIGPGAIPWFIVAELFAQNSITAAVSVAGTANWIANFLVGLIFQPLTDAIHPYTFVPFLVLLVLFFLFTYFVVPETKGLTIAEINAKLRNNKNKGGENINDENGTANL